MRIRLRNGCKTLYNEFTTVLQFIRNRDMLILIAKIKNFCVPLIEVSQKPNNHSSDCFKITGMVRKISLLALLMMIGGLVMAQTTKYQVEMLSGKHKLKTLKLRPGVPVEIGKFMTGNDSVNESRYYKGLFTSGDRESLTLSVKSIKSVSFIRNGPTLARIVPASLSKIPFGPDTTLRFTTQEVDYLSYMKRKGSGFDPTVPLILGSLGVMMLSPLICYDYKEHKINTDRLPYWSIGSTVGVVCGISSIFLNAQRNHHQYQFRSEWPYKFRKQWKFK